MDRFESMRVLPAAVDAALLGLGITRVPSYQVEAPLRAGILVRVLRSFEGPPLPVHFLYAGQGRLPLKLRALPDFAAPRLRNRLQQTEHALAATGSPPAGPQRLARANDSPQSPSLIA